jgi:hypothetical protein
MKSSTVFICFFISLHCTAQNPTDKLPIEQNAFDAFVRSLDTTYLYFDTYEKFKTNTDKIYFNIYTYSTLSLLLNISDEIKDKNFFEFKIPKDKELNIPADTAIRTLSSNYKLAFPIDRKKKKEILNLVDRDIWAGVTSRYYYNGFYYVRIFIEVSVDWKSNSAFVKLDKAGKPLKIVYLYSAN